MCRTRNDAAAAVTFVRTGRARRVHRTNMSPLSRRGDRVQRRTDLSAEFTPASRAPQVHTPHPSRSNNSGGGPPFSPPRPGNVPESPSPANDARGRVSRSPLITVNNNNFRLCSFADNTQRGRRERAHVRSEMTRGDL